jgi:polysaccharide export outer membrane protein
MRKSFITLSLLIVVGFTGICEDIKIPGFGNQLILTNPNLAPALTLKRTMGATKYKMTPGDTYQFTAQIDTTITVPLVLDDNYQLEIPFLGNMDVRGLYFSDVRATIIKKIKAKVPVQFVDFTLTSMAMIDVLIYGGVENPGIATVTPINTLWDAILLAKGLKKDASYRQIELVRGEKKIVVDIAKFVREGDLTQNPVLEPGDKIYVPHAQIICTISGNVKYPDTFEMIDGETLSDLIGFAGGLLPGSLENEIEIARMEEGRNINIKRTSFSEAKGFALQMGDRARVRSMYENKETILVEGALFGKLFSGDEPQVPPVKPIVVSIPFVEGLTLLQLVEKLGGPTPLANAENSFVIRESSKEKIPVNVKKLVETRDPALDIKLKPDDHIFIPMKNLTVAIGGEVINPGGFPYQTGGKVMDYIKLAGGIKADSADLGSIYLLDETGRTTLIALDTELKPGALVYVGKSALNNTVTVLEQVGMIIGFTASLIGLITLISDTMYKVSRALQ